MPRVPFFYLNSRRKHLMDFFRHSLWHGDDSFPPFHLQRHFESAVGTQPEVLVFAVINFEPKQLSEIKALVAWVFTCRIVPLDPLLAKNW